MSPELAKNHTSILIDEDQMHALTRMTKTKSGVVVKRSDHNAIPTELAIPWNNSQKKREKIDNLNFKDKIWQTLFEK